MFPSLNFPFPHRSPPFWLLKNFKVRLGASGEPAGGEQRSRPTRPNPAQTRPLQPQEEVDFQDIQDCEQMLLNYTYFAIASAIACAGEPAGSYNYSLDVLLYAKFQ